MSIGMIAQYGSPDGLDTPTGTDDALNPYWSVPVALPVGYVDGPVIPAGSLLVVALAASYEATGDVQSVWDSVGNTYTQQVEQDLSDALTANTTVWTSVTETDLDPAVDLLSFSFLEASYTALTSELFWSIEAVWIGPSAVVGLSDEDSDVAGGAVTVLPDATATALTSRDSTFIAVEVIAESGVPIADFADEVVAAGTFTLADAFVPSTGTPTEAFAIRISTLEDEVTGGTYTPTDGPDWAADASGLSYGLTLLLVREFNTITSDVRPEDPVDGAILDFIATETGRLISDVSFDEEHALVTGDITEDDHAAIDAAITAYIASLPPAPPTESAAFLRLRDTGIPALADPEGMSVDYRLRNVEVSLLDAFEIMILPPSQLDELREAVLDTAQVAPILQTAEAEIDTVFAPTDVPTAVPGLALDVIAGHLYEVGFVVRSGIPATGDLALALGRSGDVGVADSVTVTTIQDGDGVGLVELQRLVFTDYPLDGDFTITIGEETTAPIDWDVAATLVVSIKDAIEALAAGYLVAVADSDPYESVYVSTFVVTLGAGVSTFDDVPEMVVDGANLTNTPVATDSYGGVRVMTTIASDTEEVHYHVGPPSVVFDTGTLVASAGGANGLSTLTGVVRALTSGTLELLAWQTSGGETGIYPDSYGTLRALD